MLNKNMDNIKSIAVIDFETTGLSPQEDYPTEIAMLKVCLKSKQSKTFSKMIKLPEGVEVSEFITNLAGLTTDYVNENGEVNSIIKLNVESMIDDKALVVAHNANFDLGFLYYHFDIQPKHFICTRSVEFMTNPHLSSSLKDVYPRYLGDKEQTHRALDDVLMTFDVLEEQSRLHEDTFNFFLNKIVSTPERSLSFRPSNAIVLDFAEKFILK